MTFLSFMEVDVEGKVNVSKLGKKPYLTAGCGGFVDITAHAKKIVFSGWFEAGAEISLTEKGLTVQKPGKFTKMVKSVEHVTFSGAWARAQGQEVLYVTERCVIRLTRQGWLPLKSCRELIPRAISSAHRRAGCRWLKTLLCCHCPCCPRVRWGGIHECGSPDPEWAACGSVSG
jgi:hypothetical protein